MERQRNCFRAVYKLRVKIHRKWLDNFCRYTYKVASEYITKPSSWPTVKPNDGTGLQGCSIANNLCQFVSEQADLVTGMGVSACNESLVPYRPPQSYSRCSKWEEVNPQAPSSFIGSPLGAILLIKHRPIMI